MSNNKQLINQKFIAPIAIFSFIIVFIAVSASSALMATVIFGEPITSNTIITTTLHMMTTY